MTPNQPSTSSPPDFVLKRGSDRRSSNHISSPPYVTGEGLVLVDRRSHLERRSCWIRGFTIDGGNSEH